MEINLNGIRMHYEHVGTGAAVLLIHAFPLAGAMWQTQLAALRTHYRVIVPDLRGFGRTDAPPGPATMDQQADDLAALLRHLGIAHATIVGLSMGGYIAFALWRRHRELVTALVLADTRAGADHAEGRAAREANARLVEEQGAAVLADRLIPNLVASSASETIRNELRSLISANSPTGIAAALRGMAIRPDSTPDLPTITVPTLVLVGEQDTLTPPSEATMIHEGIIGSQLVSIPGVGHMSNLEQPEAFNAALLAFLGT
ncbi:MAG: alpha/beta fold hydrolase [Oscillochloridaceae bacterium umkhey_bin13]